MKVACSNISYKVTQCYWLFKTWQVIYSSLILWCLYLLNERPIKLICLESLLHSCLKYFQGTQGPTFENEFVPAANLVCVGISKGILYVTFAFQYVSTFNTSRQFVVSRKKNLMQFKREPVKFTKHKKTNITNVKFSYRAKFKINYSYIDQLELSR